MNRRRTSPAGTLTGYGELERYRVRAQQLRADATATILTSAWRAFAIRLGATGRQAQLGWRCLAEVKAWHHARRSVGRGTT
jgi:hypothetical protein